MRHRDRDHYDRQLELMDIIPSLLEAVIVIMAVVTSKSPVYIVGDCLRNRRKSHLVGYVCACVFVCACAGVRMCMCVVGTCNFTCTYTFVYVHNIMLFHEC